MKKHEILKKVIKKAMANGWNNGFSIMDPRRYQLADSNPSPEDLLEPLADVEGWEVHILSKDYYWYVFSHDFAKHFFGDGFLEDVDVKSIVYTKEGKHCDIKVYGQIKEWEYRLMQMVTCEDLLDYLKLFL